ncbi:MAG TPA: DUF917 family protein [bacterium]|nr:DUF917 family protein [bacterium]
MSRMRLDKELVEAAVLGGGVLGGGGGGSEVEGRRNGLLAVELGALELVDLEDLPGDAMVVTSAAVGAPAAKDIYVPPVHHIRAVELLTKDGDLRLQGMIPNEIGGIGVTNGWIQAAALGLVVVDAPCNGRAHPISIQGAIGLHKVEGYVSLQAAVGGDPARGRYLEVLLRGKLATISPLMPLLATQAGGMIAVARNPISVSYLRDHAAVGAVKQAIRVGQAMLERQGGGPVEIVEAACGVLGGNVVGRGQVTEVTLETKAGLDVGTVRIQVGPRQSLELTFWNEYMTLDAADGAGRSQRLATFPDLMATLDLSTGRALSSAMIKIGHEVAVVTVPRQRLILGAGVCDPELIRPVETVVGKAVVEYVS